jgi:hypothetical protein
VDLNTPFFDVVAYTVPELVGSGITMSAPVYGAAVVNPGGEMFSHCPTAARPLHEPTLWGGAAAFASAPPAPSAETAPPSGTAPGSVALLSLPVSVAPPVLERPLPLLLPLPPLLLGCTPPSSAGSTFSGAMFEAGDGVPLSDDPHETMHVLSHTTRAQ